MSPSALAVAEEISVNTEQQILRDSAVRGVRVLELNNDGIFVAAISFTTTIYQSSSSAGLIVERISQALKESIVYGTNTEHIIPEIWMVVDALTLDVDGDVDDSLIRNDVQQRIGKAPHNSVENTIFEVISHVLQRPLSLELSQMSFVALGGDSITAVEILLQCLTHEITFSISDLLLSSSIKIAASCAHKFYISKAKFSKKGTLGENYASEKVQQPGKVQFPDTKENLIKQQPGMRENIQKYREDSSEYSAGYQVVKNDTVAQYTTSYWTQYLKGAVPCLFPSITTMQKRHSRISVPVDIDMKEILACLDVQGFDTLTALQTAWAIVLQAYICADQVCFGYRTGSSPGNQICYIEFEGSETFKDLLHFLDHDTRSSRPHQLTSTAVKQRDISKEDNLFNTAVVVAECNGSIIGKNEKEEDNTTPRVLDIELRADLENSQPRLQVIHNTSVLSRDAGQRLSRTMARILRCMVESPTSSINDFQVVSEQDIDLTAYRTLPTSTYSCTHWLIGERIKQQPDAEALTSWEGSSITYAELGSITSRLAAIFHKAGIRPGTYVAFCFPKSLVAAVTIVALQISGAAFVPLDPNAPETRWKDMLSSVNSTTAVCAPEYEHLFHRVVENTLVVTTDILGEKAEGYELEEPKISPRDASFVIFTSGSTGKPKGIVMEHQTICSLSNGHAKELGIGPGTRVFQFSAYTFDAGIMDVILTLIRGGCVCIPSEDDRLNDVAGAINRLNANWAFFTPTVADLLSPADVPSIKTLAVGGEAISPMLASRWEGIVTFYGVYGPTEVAICASNDKPVTKQPTIGRPVTSAFWVVDSINPGRLLPDGCIGELLIQGPLLARGYVSANEGAMANWITDVKRLPPGIPAVKSYLTGDLVRKMEDGTFDYIGRKDSQIKMNGQRIELGEIEAQLTSALPVNMRGFIHLLRGEKKSLDCVAAFIWYADGPESERYPVELLHNMSDSQRSIMTNVDKTLRSILPRYMIPSFYFIMQGTPAQTNSGKVDRKRLESLVALVSPSERSRFTPDVVLNKKAATTETEFKLREIWAEILLLQSHEIGKNDNFFSLGGDSVAAIRLVTEARRFDILLTVALIFQNPSLSAMALAVDSSSRDQSQILSSIAPFSLLPKELTSEENMEWIQHQCGLTEDSQNVDDIYPCSHLQEGLMAISIRKPGTYIENLVFKLDETVNSLDFKYAWEETVRRCDILRTRIAFTSNQRAVQVVVKTDLNWDVLQCADIETAIKQREKFAVSYGCELSRYALIEENGTTYFVWSIHHALYDGWALRNILNVLEAVYRRVSLSGSCKYTNFIQYLSTLDMEKASIYWREQLEGAKSTKFPLRPAHPQTQGGVSRFKTSMELSRVGHSSITKASIVRAAWAIIVARYCETDDVCFGMTVSGRNAPLIGANEVVGPMIATVPVRIRLRKDATVADYLETVQSQSTGMIPYEQFGLQNISKLGGNFAAACDFSSLLVLQPAEILSSNYNSNITILTSSDKEKVYTDDSMGDYFEYPLVLQAVIGGDTVVLDFTYDTNSLSECQCRAISNQLKNVAEQLIFAQSNDLIDMIQVAGRWDLEQAVRWNGTQHTVVHQSIHEMIERKALENPTKEAIFTDDGCYSYKELNEQAQILADYIIALGLPTQSVVALCFETCNLAIVSMLAVFKTGHAFVPLDPGHPESRRKMLIEQVNARLIITSSSTFQSCVEMTEEVLQLSKDFFNLARKKTKSIGNRETTPEDVAYILFTSGSTGTPKGVVVRHAAVCSSASYFASKHSIDNRARTLQFSNYAFDASIYEIFMTLMVGGTVCIPRHEDRLGHVSVFLDTARVNLAFLTPTFVKTLQPEVFDKKILETLVLIGEAPTLDVVNKWKDNVRLVNGYGPTETCVISMSYSYNSDGNRVPITTIGNGVHNCAWIVDPDNHDRLAPVGCVGELIVHGPALANGYYKDTKKTNAVFLTDTKWLPRSHLKKDGSLYKTGDLVRYNTNGTIEYLGRKDTQVKLRGQRLELGEVESCIQASSSQVKYSAVQLAKRTTGSFLLAFIEFDIDLEESQDAAKELEVIPLNNQIQSMLDGIRQNISLALPPYMIPSFFVPLRRMPIGSTMKTDRSALQSLADNMQLEEITSFTSSVKKALPTTKEECLMRDLWVQILGISPEDIGREDSFLMLGGDSISAIHLSSLARSKGLLIPVPVLFKDARLCAVTQAATVILDAEDIDSDNVAPTPFSLIKTDNIDEILSSIRKECRLGENEVIQDAYPCTPLQEGLLALGVKHPGSYIAKQVFRLNDSVDIERFKATWEYICSICDNQRIRIVKLGDKSIQTLVGGDFVWEPTEGMKLHQFLDVAQNMTMSYGFKLCRSAIVQEKSGETYFVWVIHHAVFDGWTISLILTALRDAYRSTKVEQLVPYSKFIEYAQLLGMDEARDYWRKQLEGAKQSEFPPRRAPGGVTTTSLNNDGKVTRLISRTIPFPASTKSPITRGTILRAAWALVLARYGNTDDVCFGATASGRNAQVPGIERMTGTVIGTVPVRVVIPSDKPVTDFLADIQDQSLNMIPYEQMGFQNIAKISPETKQISDVSSLLIVQPEKQVDTMKNVASEIMTNASPEVYSLDDTMEGYFTFPIVLQCHIYSNHVVLDMTYDSSVVFEMQMEAMCRHFENVAQQLLSQEQQHLVKDISLAGAWDLQQALHFNRNVEESIVEECVHDIISERASEAPDHEAIFSTDLCLSYFELDRLSTMLASYLQEIGVTTETVVPICFEKSVWTIVAMIGIMKAGGAFMPIDPTHPHSRREALIAQVGAHYLVTSTISAPSCENLVSNIIIISPDFFKELNVPSASSTLFDKKSPTSAAYVLFTSGSTGKPKGITVEHRAISSSLLSHGKYFGLGRSSRVLQFASYIFDVSVSEILTTLVHGGTICVPSTTERMQDVPGFITRSKADVAMLTSSFVTTFFPEQVPTLKTLILGGEAPTKDTLARWQMHVRLINGYAPAECCIYALTHTYESLKENATNLGKGIHMNCWIVEPDNHHRLAPIGCVGELVLQGNTIGRGYIGDEEKTSKAFLSSVEFVPAEACKPNYKFYKSGDLVKYDMNGDIEYLGRKDTQVKLRGQRLELGEIEFHIREALKDAKHLAVEVVRKGTREALIVFVSFTSTESDTNTDQQPLTDTQVVKMMIPMNDSLKVRFHTLANELGTKLPPYMVPSLYMPLRQMPFLSSMKVDRRRLRSLVDTLSSKQYLELSLFNGKRQAPSSAIEIKMQKLWAEVLSLDCEQIGRDDGFFQIGGDSISAMNLCTLAEKQGLYISIAEMFQDPTLTSVAQAAEKASSSTMPLKIEPFDLLYKDTMSEIINEALTQCSIKTREEIEDIFPCTHLQEGLFALSLKQSGSYVSTTVYQLPKGIDLDNFKMAWETTATKCTNLRTRFIVPYVSSSGAQTMQVIIRSTPTWESSDGHSLQSFVQTIDQKTMSYGDSLCRFGILVEDGRSYFVCTLHHAIFDLWSLRAMLQVLNDAYEGREMVQLQPYAAFVKYTKSLDDEKSKEYWSNQLIHAKQMEYPRLTPQNPSIRTIQPEIRCREVALPLSLSNKSSNITKATILRAAWAAVLFRYCDDDDICFGTTVSGRLAPLSGISTMAGPAITTVPIRLKLDKTQSIADYLQMIQKQSSEMIKYEQYGLKNISRLSPEAKAACDLRTLLVVQPLQDVLTLDSGDESILKEDTGKVAKDIEQRNLQNYFNYPLVVNCIIADDQVQLLTYFNSDIISDIEVETLEHHIGSMIRQLLRQDDTPMGSLNLMDKWDADLAIASQSVLPLSTESSVLSTILQKARTQPNAIAISSWDGELSYNQLMKLSSKLATKLQMSDINAGDLVAICFSKSKWTVISILAIQIAGGTVVPLEDTEDAKEMWEVIKSNTSKQPIILTSVAKEAALNSIRATTIVVDETTLNDGGASDNDKSPFDDDIISNGGDGCFISFATGPEDGMKAVVAKNQAVFFAISAIESSLKLDINTRLLQQHPHTSYLGMLEFLTALKVGGCICITNEPVTKENVVGTVNTAHVNTVFWKSAMAASVLSSAVPELTTMALIGTSLNSDWMTKWSQLMHIRAFHGSDEALMCAYPGTTQTGDVDSATHCSAFWVIEDSGSQMLTPIGCIGELVIEGPTVADGYWYSNKSDAAADAFIQDLECIPGESVHRVFRTGHLVRRGYDENIEYVGRKGKNMLLQKHHQDYSQIDLKMQENLPDGMYGAAAFVHSEASSLSETLVGLIWYTTTTKDDNTAWITDDSEDIDNLLTKLNLSLSLSLPQYQVPCSYIVFDKNPTSSDSSTGEISRRELISIAASVPADARRVPRRITVEKAPPTTETEIKLQEMWSLLLSIPKEDIGRDDNFLQIGGDSIVAIQLVALARRQGLGLSVAAIFRDPRLCEIAATAVVSKDNDDATIEPFSLLDEPPSDYKLHDIRQQCGLSKVSSVEDLYPCSKLQEGLMALSLKNSQSYIAHYVFEISENINLDEFKRAWDRLVNMTQILRTRILINDGQHMQAVINEETTWETTNALDPASYRKEIATQSFGYGSKLSRYALLPGRHFCWTVHHSVSDGWTMQVIMDRLDKIYRKAKAPEVRLFSSFIKYCTQIDNATTVQKYWNEQLKGAKRSAFPSASEGRSTAAFNKIIPFPKPSNMKITPANVIRAAWAIILAKYCDTDDVCFGTTVSGRQAAIPGAENIAGPMIATVPVRINMSTTESTVSEFLSNVQNQALDMVPYEQYGLQNIAKVNEHAKEACQFSSLLAIQPSQFTESNTQLLRYLDPGSNDVIDGYYTYPLVVQLKPTSNTVEVDLLYDSNAISSKRVEALSYHFEHVLSQLLVQDGGNRMIRDISVSGPWDLSLAMSWNKLDLTPSTRLMHDFFIDQVLHNPHKEALYSTDRSLSYVELDRLSTALAAHLRSLGVGLEKVVPFCFEKSIWATVAMMAILKAGGAFMPLDPAYPFNYRQELVKQVNADLVLVSPTTFNESVGLAKDVIVVDEQSTFFQHNQNNEISVGSGEVIITAKNAAYVLFSSGSTGVPKGIITEHGAYSTSLLGHGQRYGFTESSRVFQFSNYAFDVSITEIFTTLAMGGTVCVPSDQERLQETSKFINNAKCSMVILTPSFSRTLVPSQLPSVERAIVGGEPMTGDVVEAWANTKILINSYGPTEASVYATSHQFNSTEEDANIIGRPLVSNAWVVDRKDLTKLSPVGCIGELILQGPSLARGYNNNAARTEKSFLTTIGCLPANVVDQCPRFYRTGDLVYYDEIGRLHYVERLDAQVKLRGQRIELGHIEHKLMSLGSNIEEAVVEVIKHEDSEVLIAFVSFVAATDGKGDFSDNAAQSAIIDNTDEPSFVDYFTELSTAMLANMPRHMVPAYYIPVAAIPCTPSNKVDRKKLRHQAEALSTEQLLAYLPSQRASFVECSNEIERKVRGLWAQVLGGIEEASISIDDNFYDIGGDSIRIVSLIKYLQRDFNVMIGFSMMNSRTTTIADMAALILSNSPEEASCSIDLYSEISSTLNASWVTAMEHSGVRPLVKLPEQATIFLTGGTGFLGTQLLRQLLSSPAIKQVIALVRASSEEKATQRIIRSATVAGWWRDDFATKLQAWTGDLGLPKLGLENSKWQCICGTAPANNIDAIIHNGAAVNWNADYDKLQSANVQSVIDLLRASVESRIAPKFVFVSGGASTDILADLKVTAKEMEDGIGYTQSKFVAESIVYHIGQRLGGESQNRVSVVKPGMIIGTAQEGVANVDDFIWRVVAASVQMGVYPLEADDTWIPVSDATFVADSTINQLFASDVKPFVDISNNNGLQSRQFWNTVYNELGQDNSAASKPWKTWAEQALQHMELIGEEHPLWPVQHFISDGGISTASNLSLCNDEITSAVASNVKYLNSIGFLRGEVVDRNQVLGRHHERDL